MNRIFLKGLPLAESALYLRRSLMLKNKHYRKAFTAVQKRNIATKQSGGFRNASQGIQETREIFSTSTVTHQATRRRVFSIRESAMDKESAYPDLG
jgi:hypothetical protein